MPAGSNDKSQQPLGSGSGFPGSNLYPNKNIWNASLANGRDRSMANKGAYWPFFDCLHRLSLPA